MYLIPSVLITLLLISRGWAQGRFTQPSGNDGSNTFSTGDSITIAWSGTSGYSTFSMGIYSTSNQTITWLISDSHSRPTSFQWTVDVKSLGFDLASSKLFRFYACNGSYVDKNAFSLGFNSALFSIGDTISSSSSYSSSSTASSTVTASVSSSTTSSNSTTATSPAVQQTNISSSSPSESPSSGVKVGIGIGIGIAAAIILGVGIGIWILKRRRRQRMTATHETHRNGDIIYGKGMVNEYHTQQMSKAPQSPSQVHEVSSVNDFRVQLPAGESYSRYPVELAGPTDGTLPTSHNR